MGLRLPKADTYFGKLTDAELLTYAQNIHDKSDASALYPTPPDTYANLQLAINAYKQAAANAIKGSKAQTADKQNFKRALILMLTSLASYVNQVVTDFQRTNQPSKANYPVMENMVLQSGFRLQKNPNPVASNIGIQVPIVKKAISDQQGTLHILLRQYERFKRAKRMWSVAVRTSAIPANPPTPAVPAGEWVFYTFTNGNINIDGLTSGLSYDYQIAAVAGRDTQLNNFNALNYTPIQSVIIT